MLPSTVWWLLAGGAVAVELVTGTFYLLMICIGLVGGAIAAHAGASVVTQVVVAAVLGGGAVAAWYAVRSKRPPPQRAEADRDVNLDIGETVNVEAWRADGTAHVHYRGAAWTVCPLGGVPTGTGPHRVREVVGSRLVVEKI